MASISSSLSLNPNLLTKPSKSLRNLSLQSLRPWPTTSLFHGRPEKLSLTPPARLQPLFAVAEDTAVEIASVSDRRLYVGNIPRTITNDDLATIVQEHGAVEKAEVMYDKYSGRSRRFAFVTMKTVEDATSAAEKLNGTDVGGRSIKVNITEKPLQKPDVSVLQTEESQFIDSPYKVYVGNLAKSVTTESLKTCFSEKGSVLSAKVSRVPGTSKSTGFGFVSFSSEEDVEAAITSLNNSFLDGQRIRVNKA